MPHSQPPSADSDELELLQAHVPRLHFDSLECLRPTTVDAYVVGSTIRDLADRELPARGGLSKLDGQGQPVLRLCPLAGNEPTAPEARTNALLDRYPDGQELGQ